MQNYTISAQARCKRVGFLPAVAALLVVRTRHEFAAVSIEDTPVTPAVASSSGSSSNSSSKKRLDIQNHHMKIEGKDKT